MGAGRPRLVLQRRRRALLSLNARQIGELTTELSELLVGTRLQEVQPLPPRDVLLILAPEDGAPDGPAVFRLRLSADGDSARLHLQQGRVHKNKGPVGPFYVKLGEELKGAKLVKLSQVRGDRLVLLEFRETCSGAPRALLAELTGRHANLALLGRNDELLDILVPAPKKQEHPRLVLGKTWNPPPGQGARPDTLPTICEEFDEPQAPPPAVAAGHPQRAPLSWRVEEALGGEVAVRDSAALRRRLHKRIDRKLSRARSLVRGLQRKLEATATAERTRLDGELLTANLHSFKRGAKFVELEDWYSEGSPLRRIELDPGRSPMENAERLFERYKKLERSRKEVPAELARAEEKVAHLESFRARAEREDCTLQELEDLDAEAVAAGLLDPLQIADPRKRKAPAKRLPYRVFHGCKGSEIRVGRTARDNDALTFKHARGNDLWLHTAEVPGSHVVLCMGGKRTEPDPEELIDAMHLAVHFSPLREAKGTSVHVAKRKLVHKPRGAKPGLVTLSGGRRIELRMQPGRIERLVRPERAP